MECICCGSAAVAERPECTAQGYRRFRCRDCGKQFNERSAGLLNRARCCTDPAGGARSPIGVAGRPFV
jgi:putative transposase